MDTVIEKLQEDFKFSKGGTKKAVLGLFNVRSPTDRPDPAIMRESSDARLLKNYLYVKEPVSPVHVRRTIDQFYYYMSEDTRERDSDQVISRHFRRKYPEKPVPIMMVDQLWLWILNDSMASSGP